MLIKYFAFGHQQSRTIRSIEFLATVGGLFFSPLGSQAALNFPVICDDWTTASVEH